jgi:galactosylceramide sulfotransferase
VRGKSSNLDSLSKSLGFVKPHKTGGSTIAGIINRIVDGRNLTKMIPNDLTYLGWPRSFPGNVREVKNETSASVQNRSFDAISNHAVFNHKAFGEYLRSPMMTFTILREPLSRTISAYNYFPHGNKSWKSFLVYLRKLQCQECYTRNWQSAVFLNNLAYALGWYHWNNNSTKFDQDKGRIADFIDRIEHNMDLVLILEHMEESLILLGDALPELSLTELVWHDFKVAAKEEYQSPTQTERKELMDILTVDRMIYDHFQARLLELWKSKEKMVPTLRYSQQKLRCLHDVIESHIDNASLVPDELRKMLARDSGSYTRYLWEKGGRK